jgi:branched-chain amino acid transport system ATP-binding protein
MSAILQVRDLSKSYGAIRAVDGVSFEVQPGEILGVIGPNGSGKTTLFNSILGQIKPSNGQVLLEGRDVTGWSALELSRVGVGRTFQTLQVFGQLSVRDNLIAAAQEFEGSFFGRLFAAGDAGLRARADAMIEFVRLKQVALLPAGQLSYGQQKLVDIAMAFMARPRLVLLDEPCAGVNPMLIGAITEMLATLNARQGGTFVLIEHNMEFVMRLCHRIIVLVEGRVFAVGTPAQIRENAGVLEAYLGS